MRVAHVITRLIVGGAQENTISTVLGLARRPDVTVELYSGPTAGPEGSLENAFDAWPDLLKSIPALVRPVSPIDDFRGLQQLTAAFKSSRPDIVHTHSGKAGILGRWAAQRAGVPVIIHSIHGPSFGRFQGAVANVLFTCAERWAGKFTTHFVSVADAMTRQYLSAGIGQPEQYSTVRSGFNLQPYLNAENDLELRRSLGLAPDDFVVGKIARLFELKGHEDLFAAAAQVVQSNSRVRFLLLGDGPLRAGFEQELRERNLLPYFRFAGLVSPARVPAYIGIMDALVHLSRREGLPRALPQALAAAKPVIAFDCDGAREVCINDRTGILLVPGDLKGLAAAINRLANDPQVRVQLGQNGRELVKARFDENAMVDAIYELYRRLLQQ